MINIKLLPEASTLEAPLLGFLTGSSNGHGISVVCEVTGVERKMDWRDHDQA
jgi:hypothetical protein